jgi:preprotein translocase subunit SecG
MIGVLFKVLLFITATLLILLILVQKGKGGGLAGAFGGMGGQSAFGTKAGDLFTKITIGLATFWIILCLVSVAVLTESSRLKATVGTTPASSSSDSGAGEGTPAPEGDATPEDPAGS